jgi:biotin carboxylase
MRPLVLVMPNRAYRAGDFLAAAQRAGAEVLVASDRCHMLDERYAFPRESIVVDYHDPEGAAATIAAAAAPHRPQAVIATEGETPALVAALAARALGLPALGVSGARAARDKLASRRACAGAGVPVPRFAAVPAAGAGATPPPAIGFPCVLKPTFLAASRGVMRADDPAGYAAAHRRLAALLAVPEVRALDPAAAELILVESFVPGAEVSLEGIVRRGELLPLALFDKPDPLDGPFFEETLYVTPSRHPAALQDAAIAVAAAAARALGIDDGPVHAELRLGPSGPVLLEIAARSIGGLCGRMLRFGAGLTLEDVIVRHALGLELGAPARERRAAGVMMLPIPAAGVLRGVRGVDAARAVAGVEDVVITAPLESELTPLPEGSSYLGFLFARGERPDEVEAALRAAHRELGFDVTPLLPTTR